MARGLAEAGAEVILNARDPAALEAAAAALSAEGLRARTCAFDVRDRAAMAAALAEAGPVDILVHNAGNQHRAPIEDITEAGWASVMDTHLTALFRLSQILVPGMKARGRGKIIATGSLASELEHVSLKWSHLSERSCSRN
jgi:gluconate 5-dehydrogenase